MPTYHFRIPRGRYAIVKGEAIELADSGAARNEALKIWRELVRGVAADLETDNKWLLQVVDESGKVMMEIRTVVELAQ